MFFANVYLSEDKYLWVISIEGFHGEFGRNGLQVSRVAGRKL